MSRAQHLRVVGSRSIFQFFLPSKGSPFSTHEFFRIDPETVETPLLDEGRGESVTLVVNPEEYGNEAMKEVNGDLWLWFLRPLAIPETAGQEEAPRLWDRERPRFEQRREFLFGTELTSTGVVVVSDEASYNYCQQLGIRAMLSPPPVSDAVTSLQPTHEVRVAAWVDKKPSRYTRSFLDSLPPGVLNLHGDTNIVQDFIWPSHWIVPQESVASTLPYEAAVCLGAGQTLITGHLWPRWGLEPGLDYLEFSTPEELARISEHVIKHPASTRLLATRGFHKRTVFDGARVYNRLISRLGL